MAEAHNFFEKIFHFTRCMLITHKIKLLRFFIAPKGSFHGTETTRPTQGIS